MGAFQPLVYFTAAMWAIAFVVYGLYAAFRRAPISVTERVVGLLAAVLVAGVGAGVMIGGLYLLDELF
ncbi:MAG: hypothetical protein ACJ8EL_10990 [Rhizomicrobium sp.]|jgi:hypothetical protein